MIEAMVMASVQTNFRRKKNNPITKRRNKYIIKHKNKKVRRSKFPFIL